MYSPPHVTLGMMHRLGSKCVPINRAKVTTAGGTYNIKEGRFKKLVVANYPKEVEYHAYSTIMVKLGQHDTEKDCMY